MLAASFFICCGYSAPLHGRLFIRMGFTTYQTVFIDKVFVLQVFHRCLTKCDNIPVSAASEGDK